MYKSLEVDQFAGSRTPGMSTLKPHMSELDFVGRVDKHSLVKPKRKIDAFFRRWFSQSGKNIEDIPEFRNAQFSGKESYTAFAKYAHPEPVLGDLQQSAFKTAVSWMARQFGPYMSGSCMLSGEDVIRGTDGSGSPGFPWNTSSRTCEEFYHSADAVELERYWRGIGSPEGAFCIWNSFLKEELRKLEKIEAGDIRQINGCPVEFKIALNRFCLDQNEKFYDSHLNTASAVGIVKFHGGWDRLFRKLNKYPKGYALDVKRWDSHFPRVLFEAIREFRFSRLVDSCRTRENKQKFDNLYEQIIASATVLNWGEVVQTRLGNPSGSPNTVVDNTLGLYVLLCYAWVRACQSAGEEPDYMVFQDQVVPALYGDDNTFTASEYGLEMLKPTAFKVYAQELGFTVTAESDTPSDVFDLDFLSSNFVRSGCGVIVPKPKKPMKALASMAFRGDGDVLNTWSRACSHRINSFFEPAVFRQADGFCQFLLRVCDRALGDAVEWHRRKAEYLSEASIYRLYCSTE